MFTLPRSWWGSVVLVFLFVCARNRCSAEVFIAPNSGNLYVKCMRGNAGSKSYFGTGTSPATFKPYLTDLPGSCPTNEVLVGAVKAGQPVPFAIATYWNGQAYWAFSTSTDQPSAVSFSDVCCTLGMGGNIIQQTSPNTWLMHVNDAAHYTIDRCEADNILIQMRLGTEGDIQPPPQATCSQQVVHWNPTDHTYVNGHLQMHAVSDCASATVIMIDGDEVMSNKRYIIAAVGIANHAGQKYDLLPKEFALSLMDRKKPPKPLDYYSPEEVVKALQHDLAWSAFWSAVGAGMATRQQTSMSNTSGTATVTGSGGTASGTYNANTTTTTVGARRTSSSAYRPAATAAGANRNRRYGRCESVFIEGYNPRSGARVEGVCILQAGFLLRHPHRMQPET